MTFLSRRTLTLVAMSTLPLLVYLGLGAYALWETGLFAWTFWILPVCWIATWIVSVMWRPVEPAERLADDLPAHLTPRDKSALEIVRRYQNDVDNLTPEQLTDPQFYVQLTQRLAADLARHYHPKSTDPVSALTVPEVLAALRLAVDDMEKWMLESVPGSQLITIRHWRMLSNAPRWVRRIQSATWALSLFLNPANVVKYLTSEATMAPIAQEVQTEFLAAVYLRFVRQTGFYLIEMNSGRLRGGADRYRQAFSRIRDQSDAEVIAKTQSRSAEPEPQSLTVALCGQVKAGKSSLVNALIGERVAASDVLPETRQVARYQLNVPDSDVALTLLDTPGYAESGATKQQLKETEAALQTADVLVLVMAANSPAKSADRQMLDDLHQWMVEHPQLKPAPVIVCLTHIDLLSPVMEWDPPYNWREPESKKEHSIHEAVEYAESLFPDFSPTVVPVCSDIARGRTAHIVDELVPALMSNLSEGQMASLLRTYHRELRSGQVRTVLKQLKRGGRQMLKTWVEERLKPDQERASSDATARE